MPTVSTRGRARASAAIARATAAANTPSSSPGQHPLVLPGSDAAFWSLLLVPLLLWWVAVLTGAAHHPGGFDCGHECALRLGKPAGGHALEWFDRGVVRPAGPLLPFAVLALRAAALAVAALWSGGGGRSGQEAEAEDADSNSNNNNKAAAAAAAKARGLGAAAIPGPPPHREQQEEGGGGGGPLAVALGTLTVECAVLYAGVACGRVLAYLAHAGALKKGWLEGHVVSDHLFLAASMLACLQAEAACALSDLRRASAARKQQQRQGGGRNLAAAVAAATRHAALALVLLASAALYALTAADMYFTARYYHVPRETLATAAAVFAVFQMPVLAWLASRRVKVPEGAALGAAAAGAAAVGTAVAVGAARAMAARRRA